MEGRLSTRERCALLTAALGFRAIEWRYRPDPTGALEKYLDSWRGLGDIIVGMHAQGFDVELRKFARPLAGELLRDGDGTPSCTDRGGTRRRPSLGAVRDVRRGVVTSRPPRLVTAPES